MEHSLGISTSIGRSEVDRDPEYRPEVRKRGDQRDVASLGRLAPSKGSILR
jgi:hypothetical protein